MAGHPTASHQTVQAIMTSSIITLSHVGIGTTAPVAGTALNVVGSTMISGNVTIDNGTTGQFIKNGSTAGYNMIINGGNTTNSPNIDFYSAGTRKMYVGNANTTDTFIYAENGVKLNLGTNGTTRLYLDTNGNTIMPSRECIVNQINGHGQFRAISGNYGFFIRNDGSNTYFLLTASGDQYGQWNTLRPLRIEHATGLVTMENGATINGGATVNNGLTGSEVYTNGWFRVNGGGSLYWQSYGRGIQAADSAGASYGNVSVYGTGISTWNGYDINGRYTFMANGDTVGVHDRNYGWIWYNINGTIYINRTLNVTGTLQSNGVPITLTEVAQGSGGDFWWQNWGSPAGYYKLPGGMTFQWGKWGSSDGSYNYIRYPIAFTRIFGVQATKTGANSYAAVNVFGVTNTTCNIDSAHGTGGKSEVYWFAYGIV